MFDSGSTQDRESVFVLAVHWQSRANYLALSHCLYGCPALQAAAELCPGGPWKSLCPRKKDPDSTGCSNGVARTLRSIQKSTGRRRKHSQETHPMAQRSLVDGAWLSARRRKGRTGFAQAVTRPRRPWKGHRSEKHRPPVLAALSLQFRSRTAS